MIQPIVVGTDGSSRADLAVEWAADEATLRRRPLHIVHAAERWAYDVPFYAAPGTCASLTETGERIVAEAADRAAKARPTLPVTTELIFDSPACALRSLGRRADEIVIGHRGLGGFTALLLGSTALRLAGHLPVPLVVLRGEARERREEVLAGVDLSEDHTGVLAYAFEAAALRGAWVCVVHAWQRPGTTAGGSIQEAVAVTQERLADAVAPWRAAYPDIRVVEQTPCGHAVDELACRSSRAALLVVGSPGPGARWSAHPGLRLGSAGHGVLHHADCPVALVPPQG